MNTKKTLDELKKQLEFDEDTIEEIPSVPFIPQVIEDEELTDKQLKFIDEYTIDLNATQAAIRCGYSEVSAAVQAHRLLINDNVRQEIRRRQNEDIIKNGIKRSDAYKMLLDTMNDINIRLAMDIEKEFNGLIASRLKTIDMLNKMGGFYQDITLNQTNNINSITFNVKR